MTGAVVLDWKRHKRSRALGMLVSALRRADSVRIHTGATTIGALPIELRLLIDTKASKAARGASLGLGFLGSRAAFAGFALGRLMVGGAALGAALGAGLLSGILDHYAFRIAAEPDAAGALIIEGAPRKKRSDRLA